MVRVKTLSIYFILVVGALMALAAGLVLRVVGGELEVGVVKYIRNQWDRVGAWACIIAGMVALIVGYFGVSGTLDTAEQIPYVVSGGMAGLFLLGLGALLWLSADLRDEWRKLEAIDRHLVTTGSMQVRGTTDGGNRVVGTEPAKGDGRAVQRRDASLW